MAAVGYPAGRRFEGAGRIAVAPARLRWDPLRIAGGALILAYVWRFQDLFPVLNTIKFSTVASVLALGLFAANGGALKRVPAVFRNPVFRWALVMLGLMVLSVPTSLYPGLSFSFILNDHIKTFLMLLVLAAMIRGPADVERFAVVNIFGAAVYSYMILTHFQIGSNGRVENLDYYDANDIGMLLVASIPLLVYFLRKGVPLHQRIPALVTGPLVMMAVVRTGSRGAFLGLIAVAAYLLFRFTAIPRRARFGSLVVLAVVFMLAASDQYWTMMSTLLHPTEDYNWSGNAQSGRMEIWKRGIGYMLSRPLTGVGVQAFPVAEGTISPLAERQQLGFGLKWSAAHNSFVQIAAELGVPGIVAFLAFLVTAFRMLGRGGGPGGARAGPAALDQGLRGSILGYAVTGFFLSQAYAAFLYALMGIVIGYLAGQSPAAPAAKRIRRRGSFRGT